MSELQRAAQAALDALDQVADAMPFPVAEMARRELRAALKHHESDSIGTHGLGCWARGHRHHECARREIEALRAALQEADTIMSHDDASTDWRDKWARLWVGKAVTP